MITQAVPLAVLFGKVSRVRNFWDVVESHFGLPGKEPVLSEKIF
ncbi:hypothetical protein [Desulfonatronum sp. SC1]|nr:hypothetical protein [Desulfonatronum sp. SC1]